MSGAGAQAAEGGGGGTLYLARPLLHLTSHLEAEEGTGMVISTFVAMRILGKSPLITTVMSIESPNS